MHFVPTLYSLDKKVIKYILGGTKKKKTNTSDD